MSARPQTDEGALHARPRTGEGALYAPPQTGEGTPRARSQTGEGALRERPEGADTVVDPRPAAPAALPEEGRSTAAARRGAILMCPPDYFGVHYSINPWMRPERPPAPELARRQWEALADGFRRSGYEVDVIPPQPGLPDMVFVDAGVVSRGTFVPSNFAFAQRRGEREHFVAWFAARGYRVRDVDPRYAFEGHGDTIWAGDVLYCGYGFRSRPEAHERIGAIFPHVEVVSLELVDPRFYHLDTCFCALDERRALCFPNAFSAAALGLLSRRFELLAIDESDAARFACNAVVLGDDVFLPSGTDRTCDLLRRAGLRPHQFDVSEFIKSGGACKCLAMQL